MNPDQLLLKRLESNASQIATKYSLFPHHRNNSSENQSSSDNHQMNGRDSSSSVRNEILAGTSTGLKKLLRQHASKRNNDFVEPESETSHNNTAKNRAGRRPVAAESNSADDASNSSTLNDSSILMSETISFIKDNIEKQQDPSSDQILSYINQLIKSKVSPQKQADTAPQQQQQEEEEETSTRAAAAQPSLRHSNEQRRHQSSPPIVSSSQEEIIELNSSVVLEENEYDSVEDEEDDFDDYEEAVEDDLPEDHLLEEQRIILPPPQINQSSSPKHFTRSHQKHSSNVASNEVSSPLAARHHHSRAFPSSPAQSDMVSDSYDSPEKTAPSSAVSTPTNQMHSPAQQNNQSSYTVPRFSFHSPTGSGTVRSSTSILRSVLNSSKNRLDLSGSGNHPPFLLGNNAAEDNQDATSDRSAFRSYPSSTTAEDIPSEIQIPKPPTERTEEKIIYYLKYLTNKSQIVRFDAVKSLNEIYNRILDGAPSLDHSSVPSQYAKQKSPANDDLNVLKLYTSTIVDELILCLEAYAHQEEAFNIMVIQTLALMGERAQAAVSVLIKLLKDPSLYALYEHILNTLFSIGTVGLEALLEAASNAATEWDSFILTHIANHPLVQEHVVVPALIRESQVGEVSRRLSLVRALASLGKRASSKATSVLLNVLISGALNRREVATAIRYLGTQGEQMLTYLMGQNHNPRIRSCAAFALGATVSSTPSLRVIVNADFSTVFSSAPRVSAVNFNQSLSSMKQPIQLSERGNKRLTKQPYVLFDARELITCIRRQLNDDVYNTSLHYSVNTSLTEFLLHVLEESKEEAKEEQLEHTIAQNLSTSMAAIEEKTSLEMLKNSILRRYSHSSLEYQPTSSSVVKRTEASAHITVNRPEKTSIRALGEAMFDSEEAVRAAAAHSIGQIGMPHVHSIVGTLCAGIKDQSNKVRAQSVAAIGQLASGFKTLMSGERVAGSPSRHSRSSINRDEIASAMLPVTKKIVPLLRDSYYNVRYQTVLAIRQYGEEIYELEDSLIKSVVKELTKVLRDGTANRSEVAKTLVSVGDRGIYQLMDILQHETHHNSKVRMSAAVGLASTPVESASIDGVVDTLFHAARDRVPLVRRAVLHTLGVLSRNAQESLTYLRAQSLLPFMYSFLKDQERCVREMAAEVLAQAGPRGELLLVEGVLKDSNATIRCSAGYGLMHVGPKCVRTLLLALNDKDAQVTRAVASALEQIGASAICASLKDRPKSVQSSVLSSVQDVLLIIQLIPNSAALNQLLRKVKDRLEAELQERPLR